MPSLGDFGFFDVRVDGAVRRTARAHDNEAIQEILRSTQWIEQHHPQINLCALSTGEAALPARIDDAWYRQVAADEAHLAMLRRLAFTSMLTVPMRYRDELIGALTL